MKKITLLFIALVSVIIVNAQDVLSHSTDQTIANGLVACAVSTAPAHTTENHFWRSYTPSDFGYTGDFEIQGADFAMSFTDNGGTNPTLDIVVNFYTSAGAFPGGVLTLIGTKTITMDVSQSVTLLRADLDAPFTVSSTDEVVIEITPEDGTDTSVDIRIAGNNLGENAPSYISSAACSILDPSTYASIGFPDSHMVLNLLKAIPASISENTIDGFNIAPNPVSNILNLNSNETIESVIVFNSLGQKILSTSKSQIDVSNYTAGIYTVRVSTKNQTGVYSFIKK